MHNRIKSLTASEISRYRSKVDRSVEFYCWPWRGGVYPNGNGLFSVGTKGKQTNLRASHIAVWLARGDEKGRVVSTCGQNICCNPEHLETATTSKTLAQARIKKYCSSHKHVPVV